MPLDFLRETFERLSKLNEEAFELSDDGIDALKDFEDDNQDESDEEVDVIDTTADTEEEAKSSAHIGQVICECKVCHSNIFLEKEYVEYNVETKLCNEDDECPYCGESGGFSLVGEISEFKPQEKEEKDEEETEEEETEEETKLDDDSDSDMEESLAGDGTVGKTNANADTLVSGAGNIMPTVKEEKEEEDEDEDEDEDEAYHSKHLCKDETCEESLSESIENITFEANGNTVTADDEKITIESTNNTNTENVEEVVEPISQDTAEEIVANSEEEAEVEPAEEETEEETEVDVDEIQEESFNKLGTNFLKKTYENVQSFRATSVKADDRHMVIEGLISFKSGSKKKTSFIFEAANASTGGKVKFYGENKDIARGSRAFIVEGNVSEKKLVMESLRYNYRAKTPAGKSVRVSGTIRNDE